MHMLFSCIVFGIWSFYQRARAASPPGVRGCARGFSSVWRSGSCGGDAAV